ncbi:helix-turn-helix domain-containing protein [Paenibacillus xylanexedens]|uniref:helix-turn-helix domain-containing protein n=1 Tax=Paenibacillus xylanexedens TaxID=528191 RepID=UPI0011A1A6AC|nr:AraC family transcriptional regulator [Paenibacillus xylanexedens]
MLSTLYECQEVRKVADDGTVFPIRLHVSNPTLVIPLSGIRLRAYEREYTLGSGKCIFLQSMSDELELEPIELEAMHSVYIISFQRYQLVEQTENSVQYQLSDEQLPENGRVMKFARHLQSSLQELVERVMHAANPKRNPQVNLMLNELLQQVFIHWDDAEGNYVRERSIKQVCTYMQHNLDTNLTRLQLAQMSGFNPSYFSSLFRKETGWSFGDYLNRLRLDEAKRLLLTTSDSLQTIALRTGFSDSSYLSKTFKKHVHITPGAFRSLQQTKQIAALQFVGALLAIGITPILTTNEIYDSSELLHDELQQTVVTDNAKLIEQMREVRPELILAPTYFYHFPDVLTALEEIAPVVTLEWGKLDKIEEVEKVGALFAREQASREWLSQYQSNVNETRRLLKSVILPQQTVGIYELNYDQRWLIPHTKVRSAYNLYQALQCAAPDRIQKEVLDKDRPLFIQEEEMIEYAADHMLVIIPTSSHENGLEKLTSRQVWQRLITEQGCRIYPLVLNEFWMDDGLSLDKQLEKIRHALLSSNESNDCTGMKPDHNTSTIR